MPESICETDGEEHTIVEDLIDLTPDTSQYVYYCSKCYMCFPCAQTNNKTN